MSIKFVRPYLRARLNALGFKEHTEAFNTENIASTVLNKSYHIGQGEIFNKRMQMDHSEVESSIALKFYIKGFRDTASAIDTSISLTEDILQSIISPSNRLLGNVKDVIFNSAAYEPLTVSNDNTVMATIDLKVLSFIVY
jgi:hypothetical protein